MGTIIKMGSNWQCMVRIKDHPQLSKSFRTNADAKRWGIETELKIRREDAGIAKISYPTFSDIGLRYIADVSIFKKGLELIKNATLPFNTTVDAIGKKFAKLCKKYKIKDAVPHDLCHNSLSDFMCVKNLNVPETMLIAGHKDPRMLLRIYNNLQVQHVAEKLK